MKTLSKEEEDFPLAFIITIHKDLEVFVRLLRAIYAPHNIYCIHIDAKASEDYKISVEKMVECFPNVFLSSVSEVVTYAGFSRLKADINCMEDLMNSPVKWQRVINLCGQDFPVQSNLELVRHMQAAVWRDNNMTPGIKQPEYIRYRTELQHKEVAGYYVASLGKEYKKSPPPHNLKIYFGTAYYSLQRAFVEYVLTSPVAQDLLEWSKDTYSPDEHYWVTLNHIKDVPGSRVNGGWEGNIRAIKWKDQEGTAHNGCNGHYIRDICIYNVDDLPWVIKMNSMFANKFESDSFPEALDCLEQWHRHKVLQQATVIRGPKLSTHTNMLLLIKILSKEEEDFPLAFIITIHKDLEVFARLLRAIYAPHNIYCIHIDAKASEDYKISVEKMVECFPNVFLSSVSEVVTYAGFSRLKADINCMEDLMNSPVKWQRVINLCGQDFPVQSNLELVRHMQAAVWRDNNMTPGIKQPEYIRYRTELQHKEVAGYYVASLGKEYKKSPPPHNLKIYFGTAYYSLQRAFVEYVLTSPVAQDLLEWSKDTYSPDEHYWVTLNHIKDVPGSRITGGWKGNIRAFKWKDQEGTAHQGCNGTYIRDICIYNVGDLPWIIKMDSMFANKFDTSLFPEALDCLEQWHRHKVLQQATVPTQSSWQLV
ncbi:Beta-1,3-galactosyl-O-glycosyl-glycoprotein beta-1,6-N-acetylglucosaminyltransferase 7 [Bagarius yarrelli]|uniref:Beta-1,3-galactosyl-O-glycosyl-glycoprotein beta-1,6-N-acetylglucosaminyltransferase 7 n=1 Tax=Bagarius yarrelli TaxID=175774 RepID=A0A556U3J8_BAGYA|nr:Beta-1,3-galactosyl-O-glycosyl-glycoprotein beta-1,6-N-acetylglucosaminyltransferase 7 [Bagarius yarrelli]